MTEQERINNLIELRKWAIEKYEQLDRVQPTAQMTHREVAVMLETIVNSIDDLIKDKVTFS